MTTQPREIGSITTSPEQQARFAKTSPYFTCPQCGLKHYNLIEKISAEEFDSVGYVRGYEELKGAIASRKALKNSRSSTNSRNNNFQVGMKRKTIQNTLKIIVAMMIMLLMRLLT